MRQETFLAIPDGKEDGANSLMLALWHSSGAELGHITKCMPRSAGGSAQSDLEYGTTPRLFH